MIVGVDGRQGGGLRMSAGSARRRGRAAAIAVVVALVVVVVGSAVVVIVQGGMSLFAEVSVARWRERVGAGLSIAGVIAFVVGVVPAWRAGFFRPRLAWPSRSEGFTAAQRREAMRAVRRGQVVPAALHGAAVQSAGEVVRQGRAALVVVGLCLNTAGVGLRTADAWWSAYLLVVPALMLTGWVAIAASARTARRWLDAQGPSAPAHEVAR